jgi:hypothetical protein
MTKSLQRRVSRLKETLIQASLNWMLIIYYLGACALFGWLGWKLVELITWYVLKR